MPEASTFIDVGCNMGFTAAMIFDLWSPKEGLNGPSLTESYRALKCHHSVNMGTWWRPVLSSVCGDPKINALCATGAGTCASYPTPRVFSFDGMAEILKNTTKALCNVNQTLCTTKRWQGIHTALTTNKLAAKGFMLFQQNAGEGSKIEASNSFQAGTNSIKVPVTSIDLFCQQNNISTVDVLKIDAEGHDTGVIEGALETLTSRHVGFVLFEMGEPMLVVGKTFDTLEKLGFVCFSPTRSETEPLITLSHGCFVSEYGWKMGGGKWDQRVTVGGNAYCVHQERQPGLFRSLLEASLLFTEHAGTLCNWPLRAGYGP